MNKGVNDMLNRTTYRKAQAQVIDAVGTSLALAYGATGTCIVSSFIVHWIAGSNAYTQAVDTWLVLPVFTYLMG
jgi:hypothetical protein